MSRKETFQRLRTILVRQRKALLQAIEAGLDELAELPAEVGDLADFALDREHDEISSQLTTNVSRELAQIEHALRRMRAGTYGICEACGKKIPLVRLRALPYATSCVSCRRNVEPHRSRTPAASRWEDELTSDAFAVRNVETASV